MRRFVVALLVIGMVLLGACAPPTPTPAPAPAQTPSSTPKPPPEYKIVSFTLEGNGDEHMFPIYLRNDQILHLSWLVKEGEKVWFHILTPSGKSLGFYENEGQYANGTLCDHGTRLMLGGTTRFSPLDYDWGEGYYQMLVTSYYSSFSKVEVQYWIKDEPTLSPPSTSSATPAVTSSSDITSEPLAYDGKEIELSGQTYLVGSAPRLLVDGKSGINITGNTASLQKGFYRLTGEYDADTNTLNVTEFDEEEVKHLAIEAGKELGIDLVPVSVQGLIATTPKEVANTLASYISIPHFTKDIPIYPYVVYTKDGFYLALSDTSVNLPSEFTFLYEGKDYGFTFSAGEVKGTLVKTPLKEINFGPKWELDEFCGVIIANSISSFASLNTTVEQVNAEPDKYAFSRVSVTASYIVTTATIDYSDIKVPMGQGVLANRFTDFFEEDEKKRLETIDPERRVWQLRECQVTGTIIYPTEEILKYLDYSAPLSKSEVIERLKPVLIVDTLVDDEVEVVNISELNPTVGDPSRYWGKVVQFEGYALGINYPLKTLVKAVTARDIPVNVNLLAVGIADKPAIGSQLAIIGLNNDLIDEQGEIIKGKYKFKVAVTRMPEGLVSGTPYADTVFFLLSKEELPIEIPTPEL